MTRFPLILTGNLSLLNKPHSTWNQVTEPHRSTGQALDTLAERANQLTQAAANRRSCLQGKVQGTGSRAHKTPEGAAFKT